MLWQSAPNLGAICCALRHCGSARYFEVVVFRACLHDALCPCVQKPGHAGALLCCSTVVTQHSLFLCVAAHRLELRRGVAVSLSQMERRLLLVYSGWELTNIFLGGVLSGSLVR